MDTPDFDRLSKDYYTVEKAILYLQEHFLEHPSLADTAGAVGVSLFHFHRLFTRWAGITPDRFRKYLTLEYSKQKLLEGKSVLDTAYDAGMSSPGRLHDLFVGFEAVTPGEYKKRGDILTIEYGFHPTPFGKSLTALTTRGICGFSFHEPGTEEAALTELRKSWPAARFVENRQKTAGIIDAAFGGSAEPLALFLKGTNFQVKVWRALLAIPPGILVSYGDLASFIGSPRSVRAVAGAVAANPVAVLIPCHRVIAASGDVHGYRWGPARKQLILAREAAEVSLSGNNAFSTDPKAFPVS